MSVDTWYRSCCSTDRMNASKEACRGLDVFESMTASEGVKRSTGPIMRASSHTHTHTRTHGSTTTGGLRRHRHMIGIVVALRVWNNVIHSLYFPPSSPPPPPLSLSLSLRLTLNIPLTLLSYLGKQPVTCPVLKYAGRRVLLSHDSAACSDAVLRLVMSVSVRQLHSHLDELIVVVWWSLPGVVVYSCNPATWRLGSVVAVTSDNVRLFR